MIDVFVESIKSPHTRKSYLKAIKYFKAGSGIESELNTVEPKVLQNKLIEFVVGQKRAGKSYSSQNMVVNAVLKYCDVYDIELKWKKIRAVMGEQHTNRNDLPYSLEQLRTLVNASDVRKKAIILGLVSTGARVEAFSKLLLRDLSEYKGIYKVTIDSGTNQEYYTFTTVEATSAIKTYLKFRKNCGETLTPTSPLLRRTFDKRDANLVKPLSVVGVTQVVYNLLKRSGIRVVGHKYERQQTAMCHGFRKGFNTALVLSGVKPIVVEMLMGHRIGLQTNYLRMTVDEVYAEYGKAEQGLTVFTENKLQQELMASQRELAQKSDLENQVADLRARLDRYEQFDKQAGDWSRVVEG